MRSPSILDFQRQLIAASLDDFTPNATLSDFCGGQYGSEPDVWKSAVIDFLCTNLRYGLVEVTHRPDISATRDITALKGLLLDGDVEKGLDSAVMWDALYFNGTKALIELIDRSGLHSWESLDRPENRELTALLKKVYGT